MKRQQYLHVLGVLVLIMLMAGFACNANTTKRLAVASDAVSHALLDAQQAMHQAEGSGVITPADAQAFDNYLARAAKAGIQLDASIHAGESAGKVSQKVNLFLDAFNQLQSQGLIAVSYTHLTLPTN